MWSVVDAPLVIQSKD